jgi:signal transduction histidine kinase
MVESLRRSEFTRRAWQIAGGVSIRVKVMGIVLGVVVLLGAFVTIQMRAVLYHTLEEELEKQAAALNASFAESLIPLLANRDSAAIEALLNERKAHYSSETHNTLVDYILLLDAGGQTIASTFTGDPPAAVLDVSLPPPPLDDAITHLDLPWDVVLDIALTLPDGQHTMRLGLSEKHIAATVDTVSWQLVLITLGMVGIGFAAAYFLTWILTRPILDLVEATQAVAHGTLSHRVTRWADDEIGDLADAFNQMTDSLETAEHERAEREALRAQYISGVIVAQEEERRRIARELHDSTSQALTSLLVGLRNLEDSPDPDALHTRLEDLRALVGATLEDVHALVWQLRPTVLDDLGFATALKRLVEDYQSRYAIHVDFLMHGVAERLSPELETTLYRIVQEGLTNIARHAQAHHASILIERHDGSIRIIIEDDGTGFDPAQVRQQEQSLGLQGIRERARLFGGDLIIESQPGQGTSLFVRLPLDTPPQKGPSPKTAIPAPEGDSHA